MYPGEKREDVIRQAQKELAEIKAMMILAKNNDFGCEIRIAGMIMGVCDNSKIIPILEFQKREINKFLREEENMWE